MCFLAHWYSSRYLQGRREKESMKNKKMIVVAAASLLSTLAAQAASRKESVDERLGAANTVLGEMMRADDKGVPLELLNHAQCVVVIPGVKKAGFILGAKYGKGFAVCHNPSGHGWSAPAAMRVEGGSFGFQIGASETDAVLIIQNASGMQKLLQDKFTLGADASVAGGPVGRDLSAETDAQMRAEILSYSRSRGLFAGLALTGATLRPDNDDNISMYGPEASNKKVLAGDYKPTAAAMPLLHHLEKYADRKEK
jgi:lipid-binding SYLF domain-containing protein